MILIHTSLHFITTHISYYTHIIFIHEYYKKYDFLLILTHTHTDVCILIALVAMEYHDGTHYHY